MPRIFQGGSLPAALAGERGGEGSDQRGEGRQGCFPCAGDEEGQAAPEHSLGAKQFLKCCALPETLRLRKTQF